MPLCWVLWFFLNKLLTQKTVFCRLQNMVFYWDYDDRIKPSTL